MSLFADKSTLYTESPIDLIKKTLLKLINKFRKVAGYESNTQKSIVFLYTNNKLPEREIKKTIPLTTAQKEKRYLRISLTKEVKDLHIEN